MKLTLKIKLFIQFLLISIIPVIIIGIISFSQSKTALMKLSNNQLNSINSIKKAQVETFYKERYGDIKVLANMPFVAEAIIEMDRENNAAKKLGYNGSRLLEYDPFKKVHDKYHGQFKYYMEQYGYYDIFLMCPDEGDTFYTVSKEADFGTVATKIDTALAKTWKTARATGNATLSDTEPYAPSNGVPSQFIAMQVKHKGEVVGVLAFQIPLDPINAIMGNRSGMGKTGESYLVGKDQLMRSDSFLDPKFHSVAGSFSNPTKGKVGTEASKLAIRGENGTKRIIDYNGNPVLSSYDSTDLGSGIKWAILSEIDEAEVLIPVYNLQKWIFGLLTLIAIISSFLGLFLGTRISNPIMKIVNSLKGSSEQVSSASGQLSESSQVLSSSSNQQASSIEETSSSLEEITGMVNNNVESAKQCVELSTNVNSSSEQGNQSMQKLTESMKEILDSNEKIQELVKVIGEIGEKTAIIDEIVFQTKLLSFNASVEAERAGEHGRGFAVVAQEVGNLAQMSGKAAAEISSIVKESIKNAEQITLDNKKKVENGSDIVKESAKALVDISNNANALLQSVNGILSASQDQSSGIAQINSAVSQLDKATQENASTAEESASAGEELNAQAEKLNSMVMDLTMLVVGDTNNQAQNNNISKQKDNGKTKHNMNVVNINDVNKTQDLVKMKPINDEWEAI